jgi:uncharacterized protein YtpQ (UPF0354 family)
MSDHIRVKEILEPVDRMYAFDEFTGRLVVFLNGEWHFAEERTYYNEDIRNSYREMVQEV